MFGSPDDRVGGLYGVYGYFNCFDVDERVLGSMHLLSWNRQDFCLLFVNPRILSQ